MQGHPTTQPEEVRSLMPFGEQVAATDAASVPTEAYLLDVREPDEWTAGHAPEALHIPLGQLRSRAGEVPADRNVYVVCRSGGRSAQAASFLNAEGWSAINVDGGMRGWAAAGRSMLSETADPPVVA